MGVFRCILEYQFPRALSWRYSEPYTPIQGRQQDRNFPAIDKLDYNNYLFALDKIPDSYQFRFILCDGATCGTESSEDDNWHRIQVSQPQAQLNKIELGYFPSDQSIIGLKFYDKDGAVVLQTDYDWAADSRCKTHAVHLEDGERVIGYKSRTEDPDYATHCDLQLIIGRII